MDVLLGAPNVSTPRCVLATTRSFCKSSRAECLSFCGLTRESWSHERSHRTYFSLRSPCSQVRSRPPAAMTHAQRAMRLQIASLRQPRWVATARDRWASIATLSLQARNLRWPRDFQRSAWQRLPSWPANASATSHHPGCHDGTVEPLGQRRVCSAVVVPIGRARPASASGPSLHS